MGVPWRLAAALGGPLAVAAVVAGSGCETWVLLDRSDASAPFSPPSDFDTGTEGPVLPLPVDDGGCGFCPTTGNSGVCPPGSPLSCYVNQNCPGGSQTTIAGTVYDPAGRNPLPNVVVYVPNDPSTVRLINTGTSTCLDCETPIDDYVTVTVTDAKGHFSLAGVPTGENVPLILQAGKWRRMIAVPQVKDCATTNLPSSGSGQARLPRNHQEGDLPQMAVLTGGCDNVACFLIGAGVDPTEFTAPGAGGHVAVYQGLGATGSGAALSNGVAGDCTTSSCPLWSSKQALETYDDVFLGCECDAHDETKLAPSLLAMHDWLGEGGRVFATHSQTTWFRNGPSDLQSIAAWTLGPASGASGPFAVDTSSAAGQSFASWLFNVGAADPDGGVSLNPADISTSVTTVASPTSAWIRDTSSATDGGDGGDAGGQAGNVKLLSAPMPVATGDASVPLYCGRVVVSDIHPGGGQALQGSSSDGSSAPAPVPAACAAGSLTPGEEALEYLLFSSEGTCVLGQSKVPPPLPPPDAGG
ncbi:MAG TPA: hypothetical protein VK762_11135 [Polyangiaceae bacterium]|nr:hypothetical protein [Polyangiaceae bacterium]